MNATTGPDAEPVDTDRSPSMHILVVDDNQDNRVVLARMIELAGHRPHGASNGKEALRVADELHPDLILMDLAMPDMDGWTATQHLKANPDLQHIPVIVVTGHVTGDEIQRAQEVGCQDVVSKPIDYYVLIDKIQHHTARSA